MGDLGSFSSTLTGESDSLIVPKVVSGTFDAKGNISAPPSAVGIGGRGLCFGGTGGGTSIPCGNEAINGLISESASEILLESLRSTGDLIAMMLVGEAGGVSRKIGDEGAEDIRLIALSCGKTVMPHLLVGRASAGVSSGGVIGEHGSDGGEDGETTESTGS